MIQHTGSELPLNSQHHELRPRLVRNEKRQPTIALSRPFAGRIGGNQEFTVEPDEGIAVKVPDAGYIFTWKQSFELQAFSDIDLWKEATIEGVGTCLQTFLSGLYSIGLPRPAATALGGVTPAAFGSIANFLLISLFICRSNVPDVLIRQ